MTPLEDLLGKMTKSRYTYEELTEEELPEGVDAKRLESYLDDEEFEVKRQSCSLNMQQLYKFISLLNI